LLIEETRQIKKHPENRNIDVINAIKCRNTRYWGSPNKGAQRKSQLS
jgi:hypothetical protein